MFVKLCDKKMLLPGELKSFKVKGHEILALKIGEKFFSIDARCTHAGAPLVEGTLNGEILTCPWHYSQFDITNGLVLRGPAYKPLKSYRLEEREDYIFIDL